MSAWSCSNCTLKNPATAAVCDACGRPSEVGKDNNLPPGWDQLFDKRTGRWYYVDQKNRASHWTLPPNVRRESRAASPVPLPAALPSNNNRSNGPAIRHHAAPTANTSNPNIQCGTCSFSNSSRNSHCQMCGATLEKPWNCDKCTLENPMFATKCAACQSPPASPNYKANTKQSEPSYSVSTVSTASEKTCTRCTFIHDTSDWKTCSVCGVARHSEPVRPVTELNLDSQASQWLTRLHEIEAECKQKGRKFVDETFPPDIQSLYGRNFGSFGPADSGRIFDWKRYYNLRGNRFNKHGSNQPWSLAAQDPKKPGELFFSPDSIQQGELGDCSFLSALAVVCTRPELIKRIFISNQLSPAGVYALRFWHNGKWTPVLVDDHLPCTDHGSIAFAAGKNNQLWPSLVEKAYAKINGSFQSLRHGNAKDALTDLTGAPCSTILIESSGMAVNYDDAWTDIYSYYSAGCLMSASCGKSTRNEREKENEKAAYKAMGLVSMHCYTVLGVTNELGIRMIKLRNPWGTESWKGAWGPTSNLWIPSTRAKLNSPATNDGTFWMAYTDFINYFYCVDVCRTLQDWTSISTSGMFSKSAVPGCTLSCFSKPLILSIDSPTWLFLSVLQRDCRGAEDSYEYKDVFGFVMKVSKETSNLLTPEYLTPELTMKPTIQRIATCEGILKPGKYVILLCSMLNQKGDLPFTIATWSSKTIQLKVVESGGMHPYLVSIHRSIPVCKNVVVVKLFDGARLMYVANGCAVWFMAENKTSHSILVSIDCSNSHGLVSLRGSFKTSDTIPPGGSMIVQMLSAIQQHGGWKWECKQYYKRGHRLPEQHDPPLPSGSHVFQTLLHLS